MSIETAQKLTETAITSALQRRLFTLLETQRRLQQHIDATIDALHQATSRE